MEIQKPIFILAPARSGTTIFYNLFTRHKNTCFPEHFLDKYWNSPWKFRFIPIMLKQQIIRYKKRPLPVEGIFWRKFHSFSENLDANSISYEEKKYIFSAIKSEIKAFKANRFVNRVHDFMLQIKYLNGLFPDAYYIILNRDPKAIINSQYTLMKKEWNPKEGEQTYGRVISKFSESDSILETCIKYYKFYNENMRNDISLVKDRVIEIKYEEFVKEPQKELKKIFEFTDLKWYKELEQIIPIELELKNNEKWKELPENEKAILEKTFSE